jgi:peptidoglycan/xylan/chitin deacetylase (PgdA/CDA1 family)
MFVTLLYHVIDNNIDAPAVVSEKAFSLHLEYLVKNNYTIISMEEALRISQGQIQAPEQAVLITFDDGYSDNVRLALPILRQYKAKATMFVNTAFIGQNNRWDRRVPYDIQHATWKELKEWVSFRCEIGGHSHEHFNLIRLSDTELHQTLIINKQLLEKSLQSPINSFAYPYGQHNLRVENAVRNYYSIAFSVAMGNWEVTTAYYRLNRILVLPYWSVEELSWQLHTTFETKSPISFRPALSSDG